VGGGGYRPGPLEGSGVRDQKGLQSGLLSYVQRYERRLGVVRLPVALGLGPMP
jgi:hypothetical protein